MKAAAPLCVSMTRARGGVLGEVIIVDLAVVTITTMSSIQIIGVVDHVTLAGVTTGPTTALLTAGIAVAGAEVTRVGTGIITEMRGTGVGMREGAETDTRRQTLKKMSY